MQTLEERKEIITLALQAEDEAFAKQREAYNKRHKALLIQRRDIRLQEIEQDTNNKIATMQYTNGVFVYNGESHVIKRERVETITTKIPEALDDYDYTYVRDMLLFTVEITYKPIGTAMRNTITIQCGNAAQVDQVYQTVRKILLGV
jgi:restriction endonuclease S subunit